MDRVAIWVVISFPFHPSTTLVSQMVVVEGILAVHATRAFPLIATVIVVMVVRDKWFVHLMFPCALSVVVIDSSCWTLHVYPPVRFRNNMMQQKGYTFFLDRPSPRRRYYLRRWPVSPIQCYASSPQVSEFNRRTKEGNGNVE